MADGSDGGACVYVKQALLDGLERDKRALKWQLARATNDAAEHAAQRASCEAKVKDLMTIVEMNKKVASKAVQRNYRKENVLQRLHQERIQLHTCVETLQRRGVEALQRRMNQQRLYQVFHMWATEAMAQGNRRLALRRILRSRRRRRLQYGFTTWRVMTGKTKGKLNAVVYPILPHTYTVNVPDKVPQVRLAFSPASSIRSESTTASLADLVDGSRTKSLSFATWKSQWLAHKRRHTTAKHFARLMLAKRVLTAWKHVVRRRNWRNAMVASAMQRRRYHYFEWWVSWSRRRRRIRWLLVKLFRRTSRRTLLYAFVRLRIRSLEKCMMEWTDVLKEAREAMDEERKVYLLHQSEALREIEMKAAQQEATQSLLLDAQFKAMQKKQRLAVLKKYVAKWQRNVALRKMQIRIADQYCQWHQPRRLVRQVFSGWKTRSQQACAVKRLQHRRRIRDEKARLARSFHEFAHTSKLLIARKKTLHRILRRRRIMAYSRAFWKWCGAIALEDAEAHAHLEQRQLTNRLDIREIASHTEQQRLRRIIYQCQLRCALALGDVKVDRRKRRIFTAWKGTVAAIHNKKMTLRKLLKRKAQTIVKLATHRWLSVCDHVSTFQLALQERVKRRDIKTTKKVFYAWRAMIHREKLSTVRGSLQFIAFCLWRKRSDQQRPRNAAMGLLLKLHIRYRWTKPAFTNWRRRTEVAAGVENRGYERTQELLRRLFHRWTMWFARRSQRRKTQFARIASRAEGKATQRLVANVWRAWRDRSIHWKIVCKATHFSHSGVSKSKRELTLRRLWQAWVCIVQYRQTRHAVLRRLVTHKTMRIAGDAWRRWMLVVERENGVKTGQVLHQRKIQRMLREQHVRRELIRVLRGWYQLTLFLKQQRLALDKKAKQRQLAVLMNCFAHWCRSFVPLTQFRRVFLRVLVARCHKSVLRFGIRQWKLAAEQVMALREFQHSSAHRSKVQSQALVFLRRVWTTRDLRGYFLAWKNHLHQFQTKKSAIKCLITKKTIRSLQRAWDRWVQHARARESIQRTLRIWTENMLRRAWNQLHTITKNVQTQERVLMKFGNVVTKATLRLMWNEWKRRDRAQLIFQVTSTQVASSSVLQSFKKRLGLRHFTKSLVSRVFCKWKVHTSRQRLLQRRVVLLLTRQDTLSVKRCFQAWAMEVANSLKTRRQLMIIVARRAVAWQRVAFSRWRMFTTTMTYAAHLLASQRQLKAHREAVARRVARTLFASWQKPTLSAILQGWRRVVDDQKQLIKELLSQQAYRTLNMVWAVWRSDVHQRNALRSALVRIVQQKQLNTLAVAWNQWRQCLKWLDAVDSALERMCCRLRFRLLRSGWQSLRLHQDMVLRHQSMIVVLSGQQQLNQQKELHRLRSFARVLQRHQRSRLRERFELWKDYAGSRRARKTLSLALSKRYDRRVMRMILRAWCGVVLYNQTQNKRITKWRNTYCRVRLIRRVWHTWYAFVERRDQARQLVQYLLDRRSRQRVLAAWRTWQRVVEEHVEAETATELAHWRRSTTLQQNHVASLEAKTELLVLESVDLRRTIETQRQRCAEAFAKTIVRVLEAAWKKKLKTCWTRWTTMITTLHAARWLLQKYFTFRTKEVFLRWKQDTELTKWTQQETAMLDKVAQILCASSVVSKKKNAFKHWARFVKHRRAKRTQQRVIALLQRKQGGGIFARVVFASWKTTVRTRKLGYAVALKMQRGAEHKLLRLVWDEWTKWRECNRSKREAVIMLCRIDRSIERRSLQQHWLKWRNYMSDTAIVMAKSRMVLMEIESSERDERCVDRTVLVRVLTAWREATTHRRVHRSELQIQQLHYNALWTKREAIHAWRDIIHDVKLKEARQQRPVLCIRSNIKKPRRLTGEPSINKMSGAILSFAEYTQHRHRTHWRVQLTHRVTQVRLRRFCGLAWLLRSLRRYHLRVQRRALWRWFAAIQPISCALQAVNFVDSPWRRPDVDLAGSMLLLTLEELDLMRQTYDTERMQRAWSVVDVIARSIHRHSTRRAFDKWRWNRPKHPLSANGTVSRRLMDFTVTERIRARACVAQLVRVQVRHALNQWKAQYVAFAMERAQADYDALHAALTRTIQERRTREAYKM